MTAPTFLLKITHSNQTINYRLVSPLITIGTSTDATISLPTSSLDERHCRIEQREDQRYVIRDLRSSTGTYLNGTQIIEAILNSGDLIKMKDIMAEFIEVQNEVLPFQRINHLHSKNSNWQEKLQTLPNLSRTPFPVLILGPSGSGKEVVARALHNLSLRSDGPFVSVNCSALSENLIESELFGHIKGSFTGALLDRKGAFETARGGTLFLDEIGDLTYNLQAKLLRALENNEIRPVGSDRTIKTDVRIVAATHQNLLYKINSYSFRSDLYYRLNVITFNVPPLTERMEDFDEILFNLCRESRVKFSHGAIQWLKRHHWPGNIRELKNIVSRAAALFGGKTIELQQAQGLFDPNQIPGSTPQDLINIFGRKTNLVKEMEKQMILNRLIVNQGNQRKTASDLGMPKSTLHDRIKSYHIDLKNLPRQTIKV